MVKEHLKRGEITPTGEAYKSALYIALPAVAEMVSVAVIGMADTMMVGGLGSYAITSVGLTTQPRMIFLSLFFAMNIAVTAIVSRRKGEEDQGAAKSCLRQAVTVQVALSAVLSWLAVLLSGRMMVLAGAMEDTVGPATEYFKILSYGMIFQVLSMSICAAQRGVGNTRITMWVNLTANGVNVVFNYLLIGGNLGFPRLEVAGAAIATVIGLAVGFVLAVASVLRKDAYLRISFKDNWKPDPLMLKSIFRLVSGSAVEQVALRVGFFAYARVVAGLGTNDFAAHMIAMQLMNLSFTFADGIGSASTALVGQNLGRNRPDLSIMYGKIGQRLAISIAVVLGFAAFFARFYFASLFSGDPEIINKTAGLIVIIACILPVQTSQLVMSGSLRGAGDTRFVAFTMLVTVAVIRPVGSLILIYVFGLGLSGAWFAIVLDQIMRLVMSFTRFSRGRWISIRV
jgi:putative MATE family efflux protein